MTDEQPLDPAAIEVPTDIWTFLDHGLTMTRQPAVGAFAGDGQAGNAHAVLQGLHAIADGWLQIHLLAQEQERMAGAESEEDLSPKD